MKTNARSELNYARKSKELVGRKSLRYEKNKAHKEDRANWKEEVRNYLKEGY